MLSKINEKIEGAYARCRKYLITVNKENYKDYFEEAYSDLESASKEENDKWAIAKAYQALFLYCNGLLAKKTGFYSKDHGCVITGLLKNNIVPAEILQKISKMLEQKKKLSAEIELKDNLFTEISNIRITRNKYLYTPKTQRALQESPKERIEEIKEIIRLLSEIE